MRSRMDFWWSTTRISSSTRSISEEELMEIYDKALEAGLEVHLITDSDVTFGES